MRQFKALAGAKYCRHSASQTCVKSQRQPDSWLHFIISEGRRDTTGGKRLSFDLDGNKKASVPIKLHTELLFREETQPMANTFIIHNIISALVLHSGSSSNLHRVWNPVRVSKRQKQEEERGTKMKMKMNGAEDRAGRGIGVLFFSIVTFHQFKFTGMNSSIVGCLTESYQKINIISAYPIRRQKLS